VEQKSAFVDESCQQRDLKVPVDDVELYSSGEESLDKWTVETWRLYEVTRNVDTNVLFTRRRPLRAAAAVHTSRGM